MKKITLVLLGLFMCIAMPSWAVVVNVQFTSDFDTLFAPGGAWSHLTQSEVENSIIDFMEADLNPRGIYIGTASPCITAYIGGYCAEGIFGVANTGIGSYFYSLSPYVTVYANLYASLVEFQGANATVPRIARAIGHTASHEAGHACNLFHEYAFETYDPYDTGALDGNYLPHVSSALETIYINEFIPPDEIGLRLMADGGYLADPEKRATYDRYFSSYSIAALDFYVNGGGSVSRNMVVSLYHYSNNMFVQLPVTQNITVQSGAKLLLPPSSKLKFGSNVKLTVNGTLTLGKFVDFDASSVNDWGGLDVSGVLELKNYTCESIGGAYSTTRIRNATTGITFNGASTFTVCTGDSLIIDNCSTAGILINNASPTVERVHIGNVASGNGIKVEGGSSSPILQDITIRNCLYGVYQNSYTNANLYRNHHYSITEDCVKLDANAHLSMENASFVGNNSINPNRASNKLAIANSASNGTIYADYNYWGTPNPTAGYFGYAAYVDDYTVHHDSHGDASGAGASKIAVPAGYRLAMMHEESGLYPQALLSYREALKSSDDPQTRRAALKAMLRITDKTTREYGDLSRLIDDEQKSYAARDDYRAILDYLACEIPNRTGNPAKAVAAYESMASEYADSPMAVEMLCRAAFLAGVNLGDTQSAKTYADCAASINPGQGTLKTAYAAAGIDYDPKTHTDRFADWNGEYQKPVTPENRDDSTSAPTLTITPNPANPFTTIRYTLAKPGNVSLDIYSISGQKVATLVDGAMTAGTHSAVFDGSSLASGIYLYRFRTARFAKSGKIALVK